MLDSHEYFSALAAGSDRLENVIALRRVDSTNDLCRRLLTEQPGEDGQSGVTLVSAWEQLGGKGRERRSWLSPPGQGVYASLLVPEPEPAVIARLPFVVPVAIADFLSRELGVSCGLKWPNDILVDGNKLGGILIEVISRAERPSAAIIGFGVNVRGVTDLPRAGSLDRHMDTTMRVGNLTMCLADTVLSRMNGKDRLDELVGEWSARSVHELGDHLTCRVGDRVIEGAFGGFDSSGAIRLTHEGRVTKLAAGELIPGA